MTNIFMLKGLPGSGKTTLSLEMIEDGKTKRVSKDDLRSMLQSGQYSPESELFVLNVRDAIIERAIRNKFNVVVDDTNLNPKHQEQLESLAENLGAMFQIIEVNTPLEECIERDSKRINSIGESEIRKMYEKYLGNHDN